MTRVSAARRNNARSRGIYFAGEFVAARRPAAPPNGEREQTMAEQRRIWPFLVYGGLAAIASALRKDTELKADSESFGVVRKPYRTIYPARDDTSETSGESRSAPSVDADKRPQEQVENDQPIPAQLRRATEQGRGAMPWCRGKYLGRVGRIFSGASTQA